MYKFNDIQSMMHAGAAIIHTHRYHKEDLKDCSLFEKNFPLAKFLQQLGLISSAGMLTELGNEVFACPDLIKYYQAIQSELCTQSPMSICYDLLRSGLNQHIGVHAIEYMDFIHSLGYVPLSVCDLGGGGGMHLQLVCEHYGSEAFLVDKNISYAENNLPGDYHIECRDFMIPDYINRYPQKYDMILLNEVLHLLPDKKISYLISLCHDLLYDKGWLVIGETVPSLALDWRLSILSSGKTIDVSTLMQLIHDKFKSNFLDTATILTLDTHYYIALEKI